MALNLQNSGQTKLSRILFIICIAVSILLMSFYSQEGQGGVLHSIQNTISAIGNPARTVGTAGGAAIDMGGQAVGDMTANEGTLSQLRNQNKELTEMLTQAEEYRLEVQRLQDLLKLKDTYKLEGVSGRVIGHSSDAWSQTITLDIGTSDGVQSGLTVMGPSGVIGQVIRVTGGSSTVRLLTDPNSGVAAMIQSSRAEGIVRGSLAGLLYLENISANTAVSVGDVVLTSGLGGSFTRGLLIGTVVRVDGQTGDDNRTIVVSQNETPRSLEEVIVVLSAATSDNGSTQ